MGSQHRGVSSFLIGSLGNRWVLFGAVCGAVLGVLGSWLAERGQWGLVTAIVSSLLVLEPASVLPGRSPKAKVLEPWFRLQPFG